MYFVGIDISKYKHDCFIFDETGVVICENLSFSNDSEGFDKLLQLLSSLDDNKIVRIGFEATGHYGMNLKLFLEKNNYSFMEFNPVLISKFVKTQTLRKTKTDKKDAIIIAKYLSSVDYKPHPTQFYHIYSLKSLTRLRESLIKQRSKYLVTITNILDITFPEFKPFFKNTFSKTSLFILKKYKSPEKIANMRDYESIKNCSRGHFRQIQFAKLKLLAKETIGESNSILELELSTVIDLHSNINNKITEIDSAIENIVLEINPRTLSINGIGIISCAIIISEFGDISKFKSPGAMLAFAGLEPSQIQSGTQEFKGSMVKHGSGYLRYALMNLAMSIVTHNEVFSTYYYKKRSEGKSHRVALSHVVKKLIRVIYKLEKDNISFDNNKLK